MLFAFILLLLVLTPVASHAQTYSYSVPNMQMYVTLQADGSALIDYTIAFQNDPVASPKDIADIGTPHEEYRNVKAWIGKQQIPDADIRPSTVLDTGFEVHFGAGTIPPGGTGVLRVQFAMPRMVFQDTTRNDYASFRITPTWFNPNYIHGNTHLQIAVQLPKWVKPDETLSQNMPFSKRAKTNRGTVVYWDYPSVSLTQAYEVGVSFPKGEMPVIKQSSFTLLVKWFSESPQARIVCGAIFALLFAFLFFRFSGGTGFSVFFILLAGCGFLFYVSPAWHLLSLPIVVMLIGVNEWLMTKRKTKYMPPIAQVEGGGIKRGLTAPEAAVLLELPLGKVLSLVIFGMLKKGMLRQVQTNPLIVEVNKTFTLPKTAQSSGTELPAKSAEDAQSLVLAEVVKPKKDAPSMTLPQSEAHFRAVSQKMGSVMQAYESGFLYFLLSYPGEPVSKINFSAPMRTLIENTAAKMKGFDLSETKAYYQSIVRRATEQAASIGDIPQREATIDRNFDWILMDDHFPTVFDYGPYRPPWTRGPIFTGPSTAPLPDSSSVPGSSTFGDVASSFAGWAENTMGSLTGSILPESLGGGTATSGGGGFLDLSGADRVTGEIFSALAESATSGGSGGGFGGGGGGGCACAGCACACACAGGGR